VEKTIPLLGGTFNNIVPLSDNSW